MSLGSAASLVEEPFPFSHTISVESQTKNDNQQMYSMNRIESNDMELTRHSPPFYSLNLADADIKTRAHDSS